MRRERLLLCSVWLCCTDRHLHFWSDILDVFVARKGITPVICIANSLLMFGQVWGWWAWRDSRERRWQNGGQLQVQARRQHVQENLAEQL